MSLNYTKIKIDEQLLIQCHLYLNDEICLTKSGLVVKNA